MKNKILAMCCLVLIAFKAFAGNEGGNGGHPTELMWHSSYTVLEESFEKLFESQEEIFYRGKNGVQQSFVLPWSHLSYLKNYKDFIVDASKDYATLKISKKDSIIQIPFNVFENELSKPGRVCLVMNALFDSTFTDLQLPPCEALLTHFSERPNISQLSDIEKACESMNSVSTLPVYDCFLDSEIQSSMVQAKQVKDKKTKVTSLDNAYVKTRKVRAKNSMEAMLYSSILMEENSCNRIPTEPQVIYQIWANSFYISCAREFSE